MGLIAWIKEFFARRKRKPVLGLALGSGGAKGLAHLGALKAFEEEGISFSVVTGASVGAIVGALYAKGYSSADMVGIVEGLNRREFSKNLHPFADLAFAERFLSPYLEGDISSLPKPFAAWATDAKTNVGLPLKEGNIARVLTASAAIPPFFRAVEIDRRKMYDGAFSNAVPADLCKEMGADLVIGIDLSAFLRKEEEKSVLGRLVGNALNYVMPVKYTEDCRSRGYAFADVMLRPNLHDHSATDISFAAMNAMFEIGYCEAKERMPEIRQAIEEATRRVRKAKIKQTRKRDPQKEGSRV